METMGTPSHEVLKKALGPLGVKKAAQLLGVSAALLYKWGQPPRRERAGATESGVPNPLDRVEGLIRLTGGRDLLSWLCQRGDGFFVENPKDGKKNFGPSLLSEIQDLVKEFSDTLDAISKSCRDDSAIDAEESLKIRREWEQLKQVGEGFVRACERGHYLKPSGG